MEILSPTDRERTLPHPSSSNSQKSSELYLLTFTHPDSPILCLILLPLPFDHVLDCYHASSLIKQGYHRFFHHPFPLAFGHSVVSDIIALTEPKLLISHHFLF